VIVAGPLVTRTVGGPLALVIVQLKLALLLPPAFETVTLKLWPPAERLLYDVGELQVTAAAPSSEQVVLVTVPVVDQAKVALVDVVELAGVPVNVTVGAPGGGGGGGEAAVV
jgi:hypothetical protein